MKNSRLVWFIISFIVSAGLFSGFPPGIQQARAAIDLDNTPDTPSTKFDTANPTINLTVTNATLVIVHVMSKDGTAATNVSDPTDGNYTLAQSAGSTADPPRVETWYLTNPTAGTKTITVTIQACLGIIGAFGLTGTDTSYPIGAKTGNTGTGTTASNDITTSYDNSWIISVVGNDAGGGPSPDPSQKIAPYARIWYTAVGGKASLNRTATATRELKSTAGSDTQKWTSVAGNWALSSIEVKEPGGPPDVVLGDHAAGPWLNGFIGGTTLTGVALFAFQLSNNTASPVTVDTVQFQLSSVAGIVQGDFANLAIYVDDNGDGVIDGNDTTGAVGGSGSVDAGVSTITFSTDFDIPANTTVNYILKGDVSNLALDDTVTIDLGTTNITLTSGTVEGTDATSVTHTYCGEGMFAYRRAITIESDLVGTDNNGTLPTTGFPVLVSLSGNWLKTTAADPVNGRIESDYGYDIIFRASDGVTGLYHEIEDYDGVAGTLVAWVRIDSLSKSSDTTIYIYYGNRCINYPTENPAKVWDDDYVGVWHLTDLDDSTENPDPNNGTNNGTNSTTGKMADGRNFDGTSDYISVGTSTTLQPASLTFSCWIKRRSGQSWSGNKNGLAWLKGDTGSTYNGNGWYVDSFDTGDVNRPLNLVVDGLDYFSITGIDPDTFYPADQWTYIAVTFNDADDTAAAYKNGAVQTFTSMIGPPPHTITPTSATKYLSSVPGDYTGLIGDMDEVRVSKIARDADWIKTSFNNQSDTTIGAGHFINALGTEETGVATAVDLLSFTATGEGDQVQVSWETAQEIDNMGFYVYRADSRSGPFERLTDKMIPGLMSSVRGKAYSYADGAVSKWQLYYYELEDVDRRGGHTLHGPVCVDWDGDGMPDDWEIAHGLNPRLDDAGLDADGDGLSNLEEYQRGSDPFNPDGDGDGVADGDEGGRRDGGQAGRPGGWEAGRLKDGVEVVAADDSGVTLELRTAGFDVQAVEVDGQAYQRLSIGDYIHGYTQAAGSPQLPVKGILLDVPTGREVQLSVLEAEEQVQPGYRICPVPTGAVDGRDSTGSLQERYVVDAAAYGRDAFYPAAAAELGESYDYRGQSKRRVVFYPLGYNPVSGELKRYSRIRVRVDFAGAAAQAAGALRSVTPWSPPQAAAPAETPGMVHSLLRALWSPPQAATSQGPAYKITLSEAGIYRLTPDYLSAHGVNLESLDLSRVRLYCLGEEVALYVHDANGNNRADSGDYILFYGQAVAAQYAKYAAANVYWLVADGGQGQPLRMGEIDGRPHGGPAATQYSATVHVEDDQYYDMTAPGADELNRWFSFTYALGDGFDKAYVPTAGEPVSFELHLPSAVGAATMTLRLFGNWDTQHRVAVAVNGQDQGTYSWSGVAFDEVVLTGLNLLDGTNTVSLTCLSGTDMILVDWFQVNYPRSLTADDDRISFSHEAGYGFEVSGFSGSDLLVFDVSQPNRTSRVINAQVVGSGPYSIEFEPIQAPGESRTYVVLRADEVLTPLGLQADQGSSLADAANGADYLVITHRDLGWDAEGQPQPWLTQLLALRQAQGLRVKAVDVADIFDEFSYGVVTPQALKDFLSYAYTSWTPPAPRYVLLVGDQSYDYKDNWGLGAHNYVPTYLIFTEYGETVTDDWFVQLSGDDGIPDMAIGRLPAASAAEAAVMVAKIVSYEQAANSKDWQKDIVLVSDNQTADYEAVFEQINEDAAALIPSAMNVPQRLYLGDYVNGAALRSDLLAAISNGSLLVNYSGHGGVQLWADEQILRNADVASLTNGDWEPPRYPFVVSMSCLTGYFAEAAGFNYDSLAEVLLRTAGKGAAAALMPTGQTETPGQQVLNAGLFEALFTRDIRQLGDAVAAAKQTLLANGGAGYEPVSQTFMLFGDPAMTLKVPLPRRPAGLNGELTPAAAVSLSWQAPVDCQGGAVAGYNVYRRSGAGQAFSRLNASLLAEPAYVDDTVPAGASYDYAVSAVDADGLEGVRSEPVAVTIADSDGDGLADVVESAGCTDPDLSDTDGDGLSDAAEDINHNGIVDAGETDPCAADSDGDELPDGWEQAHGLNPVDATGDNGKSGDPDGDGWSNYQEYISGTDPGSAAQMPHAPTAPGINCPADGTESDSRRPMLSVSNAADLDSQQLVYFFEVYADAGLSRLVAQSAAVQQGSTTTAWQVGVPLNDNTTYHWRARAYDGSIYGEWTDSSRFFVNTSPDAPSVTRVSSPPDGSEVTVLEPLLSVSNASDADGDALSYEFAVYADEALTQAVASGVDVTEGTSGTTSWQVDVQLDDHSRYWWVARVVDTDGLSGGWSPAVSFLVNTANAAPTAPAIEHPADGAEVDSLQPSLQAGHGTDSDLDVLSYFFEIDTVNTFDSGWLQQSAEVAEGAGDATAWQPSRLQDNTVYYWRVQAFDGAAYGPWAGGSFFVNTQNDAPTSPTVANPGDGAEVRSLRPTLSVNAAVDPDRDALSYDFELYADQDLSQLVTSASGAESSWQVQTALSDNTGYYWRARAVDEHGAAGPWCSVAAFFVNTANDYPSAPTLNNPLSGGTVTALTPELSVNNANDPDHDTLSYEFELYADAALSLPVSAGSVAQGDLISAWSVPVSLSDHTIYYWRARAVDGSLRSSWMPTAVFAVNTAGAPTSCEIQASQAISGLAQAAQVVRVLNPDSPLYQAAVEILPGSLSNVCGLDCAGGCSVTIGRVSNPPALPGNVKAVGHVVEFGPTGLCFHSDAPARIALPYTETDLRAAAVVDPSELQLFYYDPAGLSWVAQGVAAIDRQAHLVEADTEHFSMFTLGRSVSTNETAGGGSGGGGCFIGTVAGKVPWSKLLIALGIAGFAILELMRKKKAKASGDPLEIDDDELQPLSPRPGRDVGGRMAEDRANEGAGTSALPAHSEMVGFEDLPPGQTSQSVTPPQA